jgi:hypothetical protein
VVHDAEHSAAGAMRLETAAAKSADGAVAMGGAGDVDFAGDSFPDPAVALARGNAAHFGNYAYEFVSGNAAKSVIAAQNFDVGVADSR